MGTQRQANIPPLSQYALLTSPLPANAQAKLCTGALQSRFLRDEAFWRTRYRHCNPEANHSIPRRQSAAGIQRGYSRKWRGPAEVAGELDDGGRGVDARL